MSEAETSEQRGHHEKPTGDIVDRRLSQQNGTVPSGTNQAVTDHKGDLKVDPSPDWKPVELVVDGSWGCSRPAEWPSSTRTEAS